MGKPSKRRGTQGDLEGLGTMDPLGQQCMVQEFDAVAREVDLNIFVGPHSFVFG